MPFAKEKVLIVHNARQAAILALGLISDWANVMAAIIQARERKVHNWNPQSQLSYCIGEKIKRFNIKNNRALPKYPTFNVCLINRYRDIDMVQAKTNVAAISYMRSHLVR
jgi:hypothetical protein